VYANHARLGSCPKAGVTLEKESKTMSTTTEQRVKATADTLRNRFFMEKIQRMVDVHNEWSHSNETLTADELLDMAPGLRDHIKSWDTVPYAYFGVFNIDQYTPNQIVYITHALVKCGRH
jgi:hypothetical protein